MFLVLIQHERASNNIGIQIIQSLYKEYILTREKYEKKELL